LFVYICIDTTTTTPNDGPVEEIEVLSDEETPDLNLLESIDPTALDEPFDEGMTLYAMK
jgi:hypothetical protein